MQISNVFTILGLTMTAAALLAAETRESAVIPRASPCGNLVPTCCTVATLSCVVFNPATPCNGLRVCCGFDDVVFVSSA